MYELIVCTFGCSATLLAEHLAFWHKPWRLNRSAAYSLGTATLGLWFFLWSLWIGFPVIGVGFIVLAALSGAPIIGAYWFRKRLRQLSRLSRDAGAASAHPLSQARIDRGLRDG